MARAQGSGHSHTVKQPACAQVDTLLLPIVPHYHPEISQNTRDRLQAFAENLLKKTPELPSTTPFGKGVDTGFGPHPSLVIEDHSCITLFETLGDAAYAYRACTMAGDGDLVVVGIKPCPAFEDYCRHRLGLGNFRIVSPQASTKQSPISQRCVRDRAFIEQIARVARRNGGLNVLPYMGTDGIWTLAGLLARSARVPISVAAPPPQLTKTVNDKIWFARCVRQVLGADALPESFAAYDLAALITQVSDLAQHHGTIAIKLPSSASSAGNIILEERSSEQSSGQSLMALLKHSAWRGNFPLQVTSWEAPVIASPSVQVWIPKAEDGDVLIEGIFDQTMIGPMSEFCGAEPTSLPEALQQRLSNQAAVLACLFQKLGYFGRCSLDSIIVGKTIGSAHIHWVECNGRWGGTSIPMTLANRLTGDWAQVPFIIVEHADRAGPPCAFETFCDDLDGHLYRRGSPVVGGVVLSPSRIENGSGFELLVFGKTMADARNRAKSIDDAFRSC